MMDPKQKMVMMGCGAATGVLILVLGVMLLLQAGAMSDAGERRDSARRAWERLLDMDEYPNDANIAVRKADADVQNAWADEVKAMLGRTRQGVGLVSGEGVEQFQERLSSVIHDLTARQKGVAKAEATGHDIFGFGDYVKELPKREAVPHLEEQLAAIAYVSNLLFDSGATQIVRVARNKSAVETAVVKKEEPKQTTRRGRRTANKEPEVVVPAGAVVVDSAIKGDGVTAEKYTIDFKAPYTALVKTVNALTANQEAFFVIDDVTVTCESENTVAAQQKEILRVRNNLDERGARTVRTTRGKKAADTEEELAVMKRKASALPAAQPLTISMTFEVWSAPAPEPEAAPADEGTAKEEQ